MLTFWVPKGAVCWDFGGLNWHCGPVDTFYSDEALAISSVLMTSLLGDTASTGSFPLRLVVSSGAFLHLEEIHPILLDYWESARVLIMAIRWGLVFTFFICLLRIFHHFEALYIVTLFL